MAQAAQIPLPAQIKIATGQLASEWKRFSSQWNNYEIASELDKESTKRRAAVFLACIGTEAYETFLTMPIAQTNDKDDIEKLIEAFEHHCVGETNVTYERYVLNKRAQAAGETFDIFFADLRRLIKSCEYGTLVDSILRDRIVMGIRDDATRRKLLQQRNLDLSKAVDICKSCEVASRQMKDITSPEDVSAIKSERRGGRLRDKRQHRGQSTSRHHSRRRGSSRRRDGSNEKNGGVHIGSGNCTFCGRRHEKGNCPAYGTTCGKCSKRNHFDSVCKSRHTMGESRCDELTESLLTLSVNDRKRVYCNLLVEGKRTVNAGLWRNDKLATGSNSERHRPSEQTTSRSQSRIAHVRRFSAKDISDSQAPHNKAG